MRGAARLNHMYIGRIGKHYNVTLLGVLKPVKGSASAGVGAAMGAGAATGAGAACLLA